MNSTTLFDYILFQLTPTRTRCDLLIFCGEKNEKLASGLFQPFVSHLNSARDQILKGGYSVTLRPITKPIWFTKSTLQRFVRFVSTPEVLERFVTIEREIEQIENTAVTAEAEGNESASQKSNATYKSKHELNGTDEVVQEENSKVRLRCVLENRRAVLCKEQAMAYARALVAGFEPDNIDGLISFADAFGASRLREACINFMELCKKKNEDRVWIDEITAMQALSRPELMYLGSSGIILAGEENGLTINIGGKQNGMVDGESTPSQGSSDINPEGSMPRSTKAPMPWPNLLPQNFQSLFFKQIPPYQGYMIPGMQGGTPYYPGNMQWPPNMEDSGPNWETDDWRSHRSYKQKKKSSRARRQETSTEPTETESDNYMEQTRKKRQGKKSSRKVIIRNIKYITSNRNGEKMSDSEDIIEFADSIIENAKGENERKNENWDAFQNLLLQENDSSSFVFEPISQEEDFTLTSSMASEKTTKQRAISSDSFLANKDLVDEVGIWFENFKADENFHPVIQKKGDDMSGELLVSLRFGENFRPVSSDASKPSITRTRRDDYWIVNNKTNPSSYENNNSIDFQTFGSGDKNKRPDPIVDDSFMVQPCQMEEHSGSQLRTDLSMGPENGTPEIQDKPKGGFEPDDLYMVLDRDSTIDHAGASWTPEMDYENNNIFAARRHSEAEAKIGVDDKSADGKKKTGKVTSKDPRSKVMPGKSKPLPGRGPFAQKGKLDKEEENKKRMEELRIRRQKRISEKSGSTPTRRIPTNLVKCETSKEVQKSILRSSTIDHLAKSRAASKISPSELGQSRIRASKVNGTAIITTRMNARAENKKPSPNKVKSSNKAIVPVEADTVMDIKELHSFYSIEENEEIVIPIINSVDEKNYNGNLLNGDYVETISNVQSETTGPATENDTFGRGNRREFSPSSDQRDRSNFIATT